MEHRQLQGSETTVYGTIIIDTCHYICPNPQDAQHQEWTLL